MREGTGGGGLEIRLEGLDLPFPHCSWSATDFVRAKGGDNLPNFCAKLTFFFCNFRHPVLLVVGPAFGAPLEGVGAGLIEPPPWSCNGPRALVGIQGQVCGVILSGRTGLGQSLDL